MFSLSFLEHGRITAEMTEEAVRVMVGYLRGHLPEALPARPAADTAREGSGPVVRR